jgi:hypothetical protein
MKCHRHWLRHAWRQADRRAVERHALPVAPERRQLAFEEGMEVGAAPAIPGEQRMRARQRGDAPLHAALERCWVVCRREMNDALDHRERVLGPVIHLPRQQGLPLLGDPPLRDVVVRPAR